MAKRTYRNVGAETRVWPWLTDPATGHTLELAAGATAELDLPADFADAFLQVVTDKPTSAKTNDVRATSEES